MSRHAICDAADVAEPGARVLAEIDGVKVAVFRLSDGLYALENRCSHQGGPVCHGNVFRRLTAEVMPDGRTREFYASEEHDVIACPWHGWEYDIRTGRVIADPRRGVRTFDVETVDGTVYVTVATREGRRPLEGSKGR
jgi:nitrite reductase (NADH) small subunit